MIRTCGPIETCLRQDLRDGLRYSELSNRAAGARPMRVGIVTNEYPPFIFGGIGTFSQYLAEALAMIGVEVLVIAGSPEKYPTRVLEKHSLEIVRVPRGPFHPRYLWFQLRSRCLIERELKRCNVVHGQDTSAFPLLQLCKTHMTGTRWFITFHGNPRVELHYALDGAFRGSSLTDITDNVLAFPLRDLMVRQHLDKADHIVCVSRALLEDLRRDYSIEPARTSVVPACVDIKALEALPRSLEPRSERVCLFFSGRLCYIKGVLRLSEIMRHLISHFRVTNFVLQVFGEGPLERRLRLDVARYRLENHVKILGFVTHHALIANLKNSDIVCMPSFYEASPLGMIEAMALGKPIVAYDLPFAREILEDDCESLLASDDFDFAQKLAALISSARDRTRLGANLKTKAARFDAINVARSYRELYLNLTA